MHIFIVLICESHNGILFVRPPSWCSIFIVLILWVTQRKLFVRHPIVMQHIYCIDIVSHTTEIYLFDTPLWCSIFIVLNIVITHEIYLFDTPLWCSIFIVLILWVTQRNLFVRHPIVMQHIYCIDIVSHTTEIIVRPLVMQHLLYWYVSHTTEFYLFDTPLWCSIFIVLILWVTQRNLFVRHPHRDAAYLLYWYVSHTTEFYCSTPHRDELCSTYLLYWYCESHNGILYVWHPSWWVILQHIYCIDIVSHTTLYILSPISWCRTETTWTQ